MTGKEKPTAAIPRGDDSGLGHADGENGQTQDM